MLCKRSVGEIQIISIKRVEVAEDVVIEVVAPKGPHEFQFKDLDRYDLEFFNSTLEFNKELEEDIEDLESYATWFSITIVSVCGLCILMVIIYARKRTATLFRRQKALGFEFNRLKPVGFSSAKKQLTNTSIRSSNVNSGNHEAKMSLSARFN